MELFPEGIRHQKEKKMTMLANSKESLIKDSDAVQQEKQEGRDHQAAAASGKDQAAHDHSL